MRIDIYARIGDLASLCQKNEICVKCTFNSFLLKEIQCMQYSMNLKFVHVDDFCESIMFYNNYFLEPSSTFDFKGNINYTYLAK